MKKMRKPAGSDKSKLAVKDVNSLMQATTCTKAEATQMLKSVYGNLQDAFLLHYCLTGKLPSGLRNAPSLDIRSGFVLNVTVSATTRSPGTHLNAQQLTLWEEISYRQIQDISASERLQGHLQPDEAEKCVICMFEFAPEDQGQIIHMSKCKDHFFHKDCISAAIGDSACLKCPICGVTYGVLVGTMPSGRMTIVLDPQLQCEGFPPGSWVFTYDFRDGIQDGIHYTGNSRNAVLPNVEEGREVLRLLVCSFYRRHTFAVGNSVTNGTKDTVVWTGVHHKTNLQGGPTNFGYPDPTYFSRVKEELAARGVVYHA